MSFSGHEKERDPLLEKWPGFPIKILVKKKLAQDPFALPQIKWAKKESKTYKNKNKKATGPAFFVALIFLF